MTENFRVAGFVLGLAIKAPVRTFTTAPIVLSGLQTINLYLTQVNDRVLVMNQVDPIENGIYTAQNSAWKRDGDADGNRDWVGGTIVPAYRPSDGEIVLFNLDGQPSAITIGTDGLSFSVYFDPIAAGAGNLQATTVLGNTTDQGIAITSGAILGIFDAANVEAIGIGINSAILAPAPALEFVASANIEAYQFDEPINCDGAAVHVLSTGRLAFYRYGAAVTSYIRGAAASNNIEYIAVAADHVFTGDIQLADGDGIEFGSLPNDASVRWDGAELVWDFAVTNRIVRSNQGAEWRFYDESEANYIGIQLSAGAGIIATSGPNNPIDLRPNNITSFRIQTIGGNGESSGALIARADGGLEPCGFNTLYIEATNPASFTLGAEQAGSVTLKNNTAAFTITCEAAGGSDFHLEAVHHIINAGASGDITVANGGETLTILDGASVTTVASFTIVPGGMVSIWRSAAGQYYAWGLGIV